MPLTNLNNTINLSLNFVINIHQNDYVLLPLIHCCFDGSILIPCKTAFDMSRLAQTLKHICLTNLAKDQYFLQQMNFFLAFLSDKN